MRKVSEKAFNITLLLIGLAVAFQIGRSAGFKTGSEWALVQADILAREAGLFMPVYLDGNNFRIVIKQPRSLHKKAWQLADRYDQVGVSVKTAKLQAVDETGAKTRRAEL